MEAGIISSLQAHCLFTDSYPMPERSTVDAILTSIVSAFAAAAPPLPVKPASASSRFTLAHGYLIHEFLFALSAIKELTT